jgi:hypothetical protein
LYSILYCAGLSVITPDDVVPISNAVHHIQRT